jgi:large subunit ribosomal protein L24
MRVRVNDMVQIIAGKDKGKTGKVVKCLRSSDKVIVENLNVAKKHRKPTNDNPSGGIDDVAMPIHVSNVMILDSKVNKPSRIKMVVGKDGSKVRASVKSGTVLD